MDVLDHVAARIKQLRTTYGGSGVSQEALAKELEVAANTVSRWETAAYKPDLNDLDKLARFFNVSITTFFPQDQAPMRTETEALLRAAEALPESDVNELVRFAEFRRAQQVLSKVRKPKA
jgi:transcriptional regulator with XRE-family HTH domain